MRLKVKALSLSLGRCLALVLSGLFAVLQTAVAADIPTSWNGGYEYGNGQDAVLFQLDISMSGTSMSGSIVELQTFGEDIDDGLLGANVSGAIDGNSVRFTKVYDGSGGVSHTVVYTGTLAEFEDGVWVMFGTWSTGGTQGAWFAVPAGK
jgi:hypothetical protein